MKLTTPQEGQLWKLAVATLGTEHLTQLIADLIKGYVKTRKVNMYGFLRLEWLGHEALEALREGQQLAGAGFGFFEGDSSKVAILHCHSDYLLRSIVQALPVELLPADVIEWRLQLDIGV